MSGLSTQLKYTPGGQGAAAGSVLVAATLFGTTGTALALGPDGVSAISAGTMRLLIGGLGLIVVALITGSPFRTLRPARNTVLLGAIAVASYQLCFFYATTTTGVALAAVVTIGSSPLAARGIGALRRRPSPGSWWAVAAGLLLAGLILLVVGSEDDTTFSLVGILAALIAGISYAAYTECGSVSLIAGASPTSTLAVMFFGGGVLASPLLFTQELAWLSQTGGLVMIGYLSLVTLTLAYVWFGWGLKHLPPTSVVMLTMFEPVVAAVLAIVVLDEKLSVTSWIGIAVVLIGLVVVGRGSRQPSNVPATVES
jgi:DME family drug/metabolite transporter